MSRTRIGVLQFPGLNCEDETLRVLDFAGCESSLIRWNEPADRLSECAGFIIPGGFSYQDRVRAGVIASKSPLMEGLAREVESGKPVLGICNGAQILVESGLVPGTEPGRIDVAMTRNKTAGRDGYISTWVHVRAGHNASCFFTEGLEEPFPIVIGHAEGRFHTRDEKLLERLRDRENRTLYYCTPDGDEATEYPFLPNGSAGALAGMHGLDGQALAFMPHPERAAWLWQVPEDIEGAWGVQRRAAVGAGDVASRPGPGLAMIQQFSRLSRVESV
jgi:phosphoribosylformylglycinamidine synthase